MRSIFFSYLLDVLFVIPSLPAIGREAGIYFFCENRNPPLNGPLLPQGGSLDSRFHGNDIYPLFVLF
ncbi:MAG: hypothetical protein COZ69_01910 [Deltaproteobacteria bacterium CG_4_8_14_3_um_filter_45_9]|nr:MAG: hypothetical protein COS40_10085 [Deltaproteobacteria bacterium CG03_land_8_20_14_0_80_45_14]PIX25916.1 MAG: hypothetical protein COZ69_01910 [Deltaproteobacteria bacterium CG_4_8_14_3_um_filter_45_9]